ncbi:MAG: hypothetical protein L3J74_01900 [Bacteroidales bacterium]|nr:hypothetical protein [Bacteroidales bacterium]
MVVSGQENPKVKQDLLEKGAVAYLGKDKESLGKIKPLIASLINNKLNPE